MRERTPQGELATQVILAAFRANGLLIAAGDALAEAEALTAARWQVLGAIVLAGRPLTVPQIARRMGLTRQSVHATVRRLAADGLAGLGVNADHRRSPLVRATRSGQAAYEALRRRQAGWVNELAAGLSEHDLETTARTLNQLCARLETRPEREEDRHGS